MTVIALNFMLFPLLSRAETIIHYPEIIHPGQPFAVSIHSSNVALNNVIVKWRNKNLSVPTPGASDIFAPQALIQGVILLAMPLDGTEKTMPLQVSYTENGQPASRNFTITVVPKDYPTQELTVDPRFVDVSKADSDRAEIERKRNIEVTSRYTLTRMWELPFLRPVPGEVSSLYGLRRVFNNQPRSAHRGLDFRAAQGDPIYAIADGVVALTDSQFFGGNVVYVDHGLGVFSAYIHLSKTNVQEGQKITRGQVLGEIGSTGRVTGPHLHLSLFLQGVNADPLPLLESK
jgi:murein DD-endopeptidase MepM/ murein hydrolase activator NlpD